MYTPEKIRNVAIVAHIDHGKTTLLDSLLLQTKVFRTNEEVPIRALDSFDLEKERGITIFAKHTSLMFEDYKINLIDTPGHADFSGEVERVLGMVNSVLLLVDASEGPMPQTRFVLSQALKCGLRPIVVLNKIDRPHATPEKALDKTFDLFVELGATDEQLNFSFCYASGLTGFAKKELTDPQVDMRPLFELIIEAVPAPTGSAEEPFLMQAMTLSYNDFVGRQATGRILQGVIKKGDPIVCIDKEGAPTNHKVVLLEGYSGLKRVEMEIAGVGDIVSISGVPEIMIGDTLCSPDKVEALPPIQLGEPTLFLDIMVNSSPFVGREGKHVTMNKIRDRLMREKRSNPSLKIEELTDREDVIRLAGRGELHLSIVIETMRREGYEVAISKPKVIIKEVDGEKQEPYENVHIEVPEEFSGSVIEELSRRKGDLKLLSTNEHKIVTMEFSIPTRGLMGYRNEFMTDTKGLGILTSVFDSFGPMKGEMPKRKNGSLIASATGRITPYALFNLQDRGFFFISPGSEVYEGMIVGESSRAGDLVINVTKEKHLTNVRASGTDENVILTPPRKQTLETAIDFIQDDELIEITPKTIRIRKTYLSETDRKRGGRNR
ncbi:MAG: translational GTPase TypA [Verrucomicrobia bacterium]|nr:translational GTPase TypA [Verrucomicrobiota bacterium]